VPLGVAARGCGASLGLAVRGAQEAADQQNCVGAGRVPHEENPHPYRSSPVVLGSCHVKRKRLVVLSSSGFQVMGERDPLQEPRVPSTQCPCATKNGMPPSGPPRGHGPARHGPPPTGTPRPLFSSPLARRGRQ
jgi:hypothetical protein